MYCDLAEPLKRHVS